LCVAAGADILSIESIGGKELHDEGLMYGDFRAIVCALGVLASARHGLVVGIGSPKPASLAARHPRRRYGLRFRHTAMQLAHQKMLPEVLAAVRPGDVCRPQPGRFRARRAGPFQGLRV